MFWIYLYFFVCGFHICMWVFGQTLLHLVERQRMGQKGGAHWQTSAWLLYAAEWTGHQDPLSPFPATQWLRCLCGYSGIGGPSRAHSWGGRARNEPTWSLLHLVLMVPQTSVQQLKARKKEALRCTDGQAFKRLSEFWIQSHLSYPQHPQSSQLVPSTHRWGASWDLEERALLQTQLW